MVVSLYLLFLNINYLFNLLNVIKKSIIKEWLKIPHL